MLSDILLTKNTQSFIYLNQLLIIRLGRRPATFLILNVSPIICGPRSPITTKNAIHVPIRNIIIHNSTATFPNFPNK